MNQTVEALINKTGIERRVTSAYNPRADGQCERMNQTVITILKKHAEAEPHNWEKWISYVEYVYNTRKHSKTGYSPFELLYGVQANEFIDYKETGSSEELSLFERSMQLKNLIESDRIEALESIKKAQENQKEIQNKRTKPTDNQLEIGTKVMVNIEGLNSKLGQKFHGKFKVIGRTTEGNYKLLTANGLPVKKSYPITKLKPIVDDDDKPEESFENVCASENQWVPTDHFDELKLVNEYNSKISNVSNEPNSPIEPAIRKRGRPRKTNIAAILTILQIILMYMTGVSCKLIDSKSNAELLKSETYQLDRKNETQLFEKFTFCNKEKILSLNPNENCKANRTNQGNQFEDIDTWLLEKEIGIYQREYQYNSTQQLNFKSAKGLSKYETVMHIIAKQHEEVSGWAYECKFNRVKEILETSLTGRHIPPRLIRDPIKATSALCWNLVRNKICITDVLKCDICKSTQPEFEKHYSWWSTDIIEYKEFSYNIKRIHAYDNNTEVVRKGCKPIDGECLFSESIIAWDQEDVIHTCHYEIVKGNLPFHREGNLVSIDKPGGLKFLFQIEEKIRVCPKQPLDLYKTTTGLYLVKA